MTIDDYSSLFAPFATARHYSHYSRIFALFGTIRTIRVIRYSLFGFSRHPIHVASISDDNFLQWRPPQNPTTDCYKNYRTADRTRIFVHRPLLLFCCWPAHILGDVLLWVDWKVECSMYKNSSPFHGSVIFVVHLTPLLASLWSNKTAKWVKWLQLHSVSSTLLLDFTAWHPSLDHPSGLQGNRLRF